MNKIKEFLNPETEPKGFLRKYVFNKYTLTIFVFLIWMVFFDSNSFLTIMDLNKEIKHYKEKIAYYQGEYDKNTNFYKKLIKDKNEKERFARENYFMKKDNEEIFILVVDSTEVNDK
ncbi:MAG: septum formation inhibitor [Flavobacteriales bacterium]|nr:MAG: septum formation inhibitor [Flavobacteriales bacterium]